MSLAPPADTVNSNVSVAGATRFGASNDGVAVSAPESDTVGRPPLCRHEYASEWPSGPVDPLPSSFAERSSATDRSAPARATGAASTAASGVAETAGHDGPFLLPLSARTLKR